MEGLWGSEGVDGVFVFQGTYYPCLRNMYQVQTGTNRYLCAARILEFSRRIDYTIPVSLYVAALVDATVLGSG